MNLPPGQGKRSLVTVVHSKYVHCLNFELCHVQEAFHDAGSCRGMDYRTVQRMSRGDRLKEPPKGSSFPPPMDRSHPPLRCSFWWDGDLKDLFQSHSEV
ncbi:hypothetical protein AVEN_35517-1 [Araneus ventricosus]|uniref:Uncharacterized protein n=1 Tax=Araneus ventricosus TaxID=182803 RepID=A0A4Y2GS27_ARAVE|nr:hypothetical protein AVEN_35517-1 [Araneus ventricosus]